MKYILVAILSIAYSAMIVSWRYEVKIEKVLGKHQEEVVLLSNLLLKADKDTANKPVILVVPFRSMEEANKFGVKAKAKRIQ